jgi:ABC-type glutathione transport system ATPase component
VRCCGASAGTAGSAAEPRAVPAVPATARAMGRTFVLTSHVISELEELADDVAFLVDGCVAFAGPVQELLRRTGQTRLERAIAEVMRRPGVPGASGTPTAPLGARVDRPRVAEVA